LPPQFVISYFVELSVGVFEALYLDQIISKFLQLLPRWKMQLKRRFAPRRRMTREAKAAEEMEWRRINEEIELTEEGVEPLLDSYSGYSIGVCGMFLGGIINLFLLLFPKETQMPDFYGIRERDLIFYTWFAFYIALWTLGMDVFLLNSQELIWGWKVYDYVSYQKYRFSVRDHRWMMDSKVHTLVMTFCVRIASLNHSDVPAARWTMDSRGA